MYCLQRDYTLANKIQEICVWSARPRFGLQDYRRRNKSLRCIQLRGLLGRNASHLSEALLSASVLAIDLLLDVCHTSMGRYDYGHLSCLRSNGGGRNLGTAPVRTTLRRLAKILYSAKSMVVSISNRGA
jgi:hypothetical protein